MGFFWGMGYSWNVFLFFSFFINNYSWKSSIASSILVLATLSTRTVPTPPPTFENLMNEWMNEWRSRGEYSSSLLLYHHHINSCWLPCCLQKLLPGVWYSTVQCFWWWMTAVFTMMLCRLWNIPHWTPIPIKTNQDPWNLWGIIRPELGP